MSTCTDAEIAYPNQGPPQGAESTNMAASKKFRDARRHPAVMPWDPALTRPRQILSWGIDTGSFELTTRDMA